MEALPEQSVQDNQVVQQPAEPAYKYHLLLLLPRGEKLHTYDTVEELLAQYVKLSGKDEIVAMYAFYGRYLSLSLSNTVTVQGVDPHDANYKVVTQLPDGKR